jgi:hypothetical protein
MRPLAPPSGMHPADAGGMNAPDAAPAPAPTMVVTRMNFAAAPGQVWDVLMFYEEIEVPPPLLLRLLLPLPVRTEGSKRAVGDVAMCLYEGGHLRKRVTHIDPGKFYGFEVVEQQLAVGNGLVLTGGCYTLRELSPRGTEVAVTTRYVSRKRPGWLWKPIEAAVCHMFHRHLLNSMRHRIESG